MQKRSAFVASPKEAQHLRQFVRDGVETWNELFSDDRGVQFDAKDWRDWVPQSGPVQATQDVINTQLVDPAHVLIAVFESSAGDKYTLGEIDRARAAHIPVFVFLPKDAKLEHDLSKWKDAELAAGRQVLEFNGPGDLVRRVLQALSTVVRASFMAGLPTQPANESIQDQLKKLGDGDWLIVVGRTCVNWLSPGRGAWNHVAAAVGRGVRLTFLVQDLYDRFADPQFAELRKDHSEAVQGFDALARSVDPSRRPQLNLKYSPTEVRHARTLILGADGFKSLRYDLTMAKGPKPFVVFTDPALAEPLIKETMRLEQDAFEAEMLTQVQERRELEWDVRVGLAEAQEKYAFSSDLRGNRPSRLVRPAARWLALLSGQQPPHPLSVQILLTTHCATHCAMCDYFKLERDKAEQKQPPDEPNLPTPKLLKAPDFKALLNDIAALGTRAVTLSGGEPLMLLGVADVIKHAKSKHLQVGILTSGVVGGSDREGIFSAVASAAWVQVSVDSFRKTTYPKIRTIDNASDDISLDRCAEFLKEIRQRGQKNLEVVFTIQRGNIDEILNTERLSKEIDEVVPAGVPVRFKFATGMGADRDGEPGGGEFLPSLEQLKKLHNKWHSWYPAQSARPINVQFIRDATDDDRRTAIASGYPMEQLRADLSRAKAKCEVMKHSMFIDSYGQVFPCCYLFNDNVAHWSLREEYRVGVWTPSKTSSTRITALRAIWEGRQYRQMRDTRLSDLPKAACGRCTRHMQQNAFLTKVNEVLQVVKNTPVSRDRALSIYEDPDYVSVRPVWL